MTRIIGCHKYSQVVVLFSASLSLKMCSSQGIFCEYMIRGTTAPVFNLTLALKNVTDSNHHTPTAAPSSSPHHHHNCRLQRPSYYSHCGAETHSLVVVIFIQFFFPKGYGFLYFPKNPNDFEKVCNNHLVLGD